MAGGHEEQPWPAQAGGCSSMRHPTTAQGGCASARLATVTPAAGVWHAVRAPARGLVLATGTLPAGRLPTSFSWWGPSTVRVLGRPQHAPSPWHPSPHAPPCCRLPLTVAVVAQPARQHGAKGQLQGRGAGQGPRRQQQRHGQHRQGRAMPALRDDTHGPGGRCMPTGLRVRFVRRQGAWAVRRGTSSHMHR